MFSTPEKGNKKHKAVTPTSDKAMAVETEVLGFKRFIDKTPKPYTQAEFQPADPGDKLQPERQFSTAGRLHREKNAVYRVKSS